MKITSKSIENILKILLLGLIGWNLKGLILGHLINIIPLIIQIPLFVSLFYENKMKIPLLSIWTLFVFIYGITAVIAIVLNILQIVLGENEKAIFDFEKTIFGALALLLSNLIYKNILRSLIKRESVNLIEPGNQNPI